MEGSGSVQDIIGPKHTFVETLAGRCAATLDVPERATVHSGFGNGIQTFPSDSAKIPILLVVPLAVCKLEEITQDTTVTKLIKLEVSTK